MILHGRRIVKVKFAGSAFTGEGAKKYGGRWNSPGVAVVYVSGSTALAMLEMLVHLRSDELLKRYVMFDVAFDEGLVTEVDVRRLPKAWRKSPAPAAVQGVGDAWVAAGKTPVLRVPSAVVAGEWNYLLNPGHGDFRKIRIGAREAVRFDRRLVK